MRRKGRGKATSSNRVFGEYAGRCDDFVVKPKDDEEMKMRLYVRCAVFPKRA
jgi:hypothetical protein